MCHFASINIFAGLFIRENEFSKLELAHVKRNTDTSHFYFNGRGWKIFTVNRGEARNLYIIGIGALTSLFYEDPPILLNPIFFKFCPTPPLSPQNPTPTVFSVVLFLWLNGLSRHIWCAILLNDNMDLQMLRLGTLVPEGPWCVFYATRRQVYWGLEHVVFNWYSNLISHAQTHKHTQNTQGTVD